MAHADLIQLMRALPEPSFLLFGHGIIDSANDAAAELTGIGAAALAQTRVHSLLQEPPEKVDEYLRRCARSRQPVPGSFVWTVKDGQHQSIRCDGAVISPRSGDNPPVLFLRCRPRNEATDPFLLLNQKIAALTREIQERKKAELQRDELLRSERAARIEAEQNSRMKDEFLATLSHELRTPLNAIVGWTRLLRTDPSGREPSAEGLEVIERNAIQQKRLIEDLLDMSSIVSGKVRLDVQRVDLAPVIQQAVDVVRPAADAKNVRLQLTLDPIARPVKGDPNRLQQVVWNLLSNAIKFTPKGGRVQVSLERVNSEVEINVSDTGEGIRPDFLPHVFDRFRQADAATSRRHGGLGLGLSIVKQLVELHGGSVRAKSPGVGQGATFTIALPVMVVGEDIAGSPMPRVHPATAITEQGLNGTPSLAGVTVLVVDDEPDAREMVRRFLSKCGATVVTAASADAALRALDHTRPTLILSDIGLPEIDGYELMRRVRNLPPERGGRVPAIALTAFARAEDRTRAMLAGYQVHLSKPIDPAELVATVASIAGRTGT